MNNEKELNAFNMYIEKVKGDLFAKAIKELHLIVDNNMDEINKIITETDDGTINYKLLTASGNCKAELQKIIVSKIAIVDQYLFNEHEKLIKKFEEQGFSEQIVNSSINSMSEDFNNIMLPVAKSSINEECVVLKNRLIGELYK